MKIQFTFCLWLTVLLSSCAEKKYLRTKKTFNCGLYVEVFTANSWGLSQEYLTDSSTFRMYVGTVDEEHDYYTYDCNNDTVQIQMVMPSNKNCRWVTLKDSMKTVLCDTEYIVRKPISLLQLKSKNKFE